jgi:hypothetical protein
MGLKVGDRVSLKSVIAGNAMGTEYGVVTAIFTDKHRTEPHERTSCLVTFWGYHRKPPNDSTRYYTLRYYETSLKKVARSPAGGQAPRKKP